MDFRAYLFFGGDLTLLRMADVPSEEPPPVEQADMIIHAALVVGDATVMGSDDPTGGSAGAQGMSVTCAPDDVPSTERVFAALADGGEVTAPLSETFFSPAFGMCVDRFGIPWMVVAPAPESG